MLTFSYEGKQYMNWTRADADALGVPAAVLDAAELEATRAAMSCSRRQALRALDAAGLLDDVVAWIATAPKATQIDWDAASHFDRTHGAIASAAAGLGLSDEDIDDLFIAARAI